MTTRPYLKKTCISFEKRTVTHRKKCTTVVHICATFKTTAQQENRKCFRIFTSKINLSRIWRNWRKQFSRPAALALGVLCVRCYRATLAFARVEYEAKLPAVYAEGFSRLSRYNMWASKKREENTETLRDSVTDDSYANLSWQRRS